MMGNIDPAQNNHMCGWYKIYDMQDISGMSMLWNKGTISEKSGFL